MDYTDVIDLVCEMDRMIAALKEFGYWDEAGELEAIQRRLTGSVQLSMTESGEQVN
jgi:hypothetical protein